MAGVLAMKVLVYEDNPTVALDLWSALFELGHTVCGTAKSPDRCLEKAERARPDLVLADMETGDGRSSLWVVGTLARNGIPSVVIARNAGDVPQDVSVKAVIEKPVSQPRLASVLGEVDRALRTRPSSAAPMEGRA
jgi:CheY-like chemotaxis protein